MKTLSIITNFGCRFNCWYCVWKTHKLRNVYGPYDFKIIYDTINKYNGKILKISGGGDRLYKFNININWWRSIFRFSNKLKLSIHTREQLVDEEIFRHIYLLNLSSMHASDVCEYIEVLKNKFDFHNIRIYKVIESTTTHDEIEEYIYLSKYFNLSITFRQLFRYNDNQRFLFYKQKYYDDNVYFLPQGDYNIYLMPNGKLYDKFNI